jgi:aspartokinase/homoserine dehydrogenase 1
MKFYCLNNIKTVNIFMVGPGLVGSTLLNQFKKQEKYLIEKQKLNLNIAGLANTKKMVVNPDGIDAGSWEKEMEASGEKTNLMKFIKQMTDLNLPNSVFVDCTASDEVAGLYKTILVSNISIVTANKKANSSDFEYYSELRRLELIHNAVFAYETNVCAGLPVIGTIKDLILSGDEIVKIEGVLSGTLSYIFNSFNNEKTFTEIIKEAREKGFTEPDPREDLSGIDVARKLLILSREIGFALEMKDISIENLLPENASKAETIEEFFNLMDLYHDEFEKKKINAIKNNKTLRYIAKIEDSKAEIKLVEVGQDHPFYSLSESDNIVSFTTKYYKNRPIVIKGPGAGADVTAAGVFADILRIANYSR